MDRLLVVVLGNRNSGKSRTWNELFGKRARTRKRPRHLKLNDSKFVDVFLISGSPQERKKYIGNIVPRKLPRIILCSIQYNESAREIIDFFLSKKYSIYTQWLNPGRKDKFQYPDSLGIADFLLYGGSILSIRNGKLNPQKRVRELRDFIHSWAESRGLTYFLKVKS